MADELEQAPLNPPNPSESTPPKKHNYPKSRKPPAPAAPIHPNPAIQQMEMEIVPLMNQRMQANQRVRTIQQKANQIQMELQAAKDELASIEEEVNYRQQVIAQMKGIPFTSPIPQAPSYGNNFPITNQPRFADYPQQPPSPLYAPIQPYPPEGVGSYPANNRGLHRDATERTESAVDFMTPELRAQFEGR